MIVNEVFVALFNRLDSQLTESLYNHIPQDFNAWPAVQIVDIPGTENDTDTETGFSANFRVHVWSEYRGRKEVAEIQEKVYNALHRYDLPDTANYGISGIDIVNSNIVPEPDGITHHGIQDFNIIYEPLPTP